MQFVQLGSQEGEYLGEHPDPTVAQCDDMVVTQDKKPNVQKGIKIWQYTWANFYEMSMAFAKALHALGVQERSVVLI